MIDWAVIEVECPCGRRWHPLLDADRRLARETEVECPDCGRTLECRLEVDLEVKETGKKGG